MKKTHLLVVGAAAVFSGCATVREPAHDLDLRLAVEKLTA